MAHPIAEREAAFQRGLEAYRAGRYFDAHALWEGLWRSEDSEDHRRFLHALLHVTGALHKLSSDVGPSGALPLLVSALAKLEGLPDAYGGVALSPFREGVLRAKGELERLGPEGQRALAPALIPPLDRVGDALAWKPRAPDSPPDPTQNLRRGLVAYQAGRFYEALTLWEEIRQREPEGTLRTFLHGLILVASAMHKLLQMKSPEGALKMLDLAEPKIRQAPEGTCGIAVADLGAGVAKARGAVAGLLASKGAAPPALEEIAPRITKT
jgi:predicted metal-dependent hydrolase